MTKNSKTAWVAAALVLSALLAAVPVGVLVWHMGSSAQRLTSSVDALTVEVKKVTSIAEVNKQDMATKADLEVVVTKSDLALYLKLLAARNAGVIDVPEPHL